MCDLKRPIGLQSGALYHKSDLKTNKLPMKYLHETRSLV